MKDKIEILIESNFRLIYLVGFFLILALPLLNLPPWFSPADWGKTIIFRIVLSILLFLFVWQTLFFKDGNNYAMAQKLPSLGIKLLTALFLVFLLATIFSQNPLYSFLGDPHRAGGFLNFGFYIIFAILAFLILKKEDWKRILNFIILIGILVSILAIFQQYKIFSEFFVPVEGRPFSTIGSSVLLALYLLLLVFLSFTFFLKEKEVKKRLFYLFTFLLFVFVILLTGSRAAYLGLLVGFFYFLFTYPKNLLSQKKKFLILFSQIIAGLILIGVIYGIYYINYVNKEPELSGYLQENQVIQGVLSRLSLGTPSVDPRFSAWSISLDAIKEKPILGWGPENFSIAFDKYYDPFLPQISKEWGSWYDRAHNFIFDISVIAGIPALIIYLSLFGVLFYELQKIKKQKPEKSLICHGIQATFLAYFVNNLFAFDTFSSYLILFLLVSFSLSLISQQSGNSSLISSETINRSFKDRSGFTRIATRIYADIYKNRSIIIFAIFVGLIWFIWSLNVRPLYLNKENNTISSQLNNAGCRESLSKMENLLSFHPVRNSISNGAHSFLDQYLGMRYIDIANICITKSQLAKVPITKKAVDVLKKNTEIRPDYTRNWLYLGIYTNFLIEKGASFPKTSEEIKNEADYYFKKAIELSPKRPEIYVEWAKTYFITNDYLKAKEKAQKCIELDRSMGECWQIKSLSNLYLDNIVEAKIDMRNAFNSRMAVADKKALLLQLIPIHLEKENYEELIEIHKKLIQLEPTNPKYYAALAYNYKVIGNYEMSKKIAADILDMFPQMQTEVEEFLKSLD